MFQNANLKIVKMVRQYVFIYMTEPPQTYATLKDFCNELKVPYGRITKLDYPIDVNGIKLYKVKMKRNIPKQEPKKNQQ